MGRLTNRPRRHLHINHTHLLARKERSFWISILDPREKRALELLLRVLDTIRLLLRPLQKSVERWDDPGRHLLK